MAFVRRRTASRRPTRAARSALRSLSAMLQQGRQANSIDSLHERSSGGAVASPTLENPQRLLAPMQFASPSWSMAEPGPPGWCGVRLAAGRLPGQCRPASGSSAEAAEDRAESIALLSRLSPSGGPHSQTEGATSRQQARPPGSHTGPVAQRSQPRGLRQRTIQPVAPEPNAH